MARIRITSWHEPRTPADGKDPDHRLARDPDPSRWQGSGSPVGKDPDHQSASTERYRIRITSFKGSGSPAGKDPGSPVGEDPDHQLARIRITTWPESGSPVGKDPPDATHAGGVILPLGCGLVRSLGGPAAGRQPPVVGQQPAPARLPTLLNLQYKDKLKKLAKISGDCPFSGTELWIQNLYLNGKR